MKPITWGGRDDCRHRWSNHSRFWDNRYASVLFVEGETDFGGSKHYPLHIKTSICRLCGAWRGQLGLEPVSDCLAWARGNKRCSLCYVCHITENFGEVRRVLQKDGSVWLNLADTYAGSWGNASRYDEKPSEERQRLCRRPSWQRWGTPEIPPPQARSDLPRKCLVGIPWRVAFALIQDGWILRNDVIWHKPNTMPQSVRDRLSNRYEHIFHFVKSQRYFYNLDAIREPHTDLPRLGRVLKATGGRLRQTTHGKRARAGMRSAVGFHPNGKNPGDVILTKGQTLVSRGPRAYSESKNERRFHPKGKNPGDIIRAATKYKYSDGTKGFDPPAKWPCGYHPNGKNPGDFWSVNTRPFNGAHFAVFPEEIPRRCILATTRPGDVVLDPFLGSGTTMKVALELGRNCIGIELNGAYLGIIRQRLQCVQKVMLISQIP